LGATPQSELAAKKDNRKQIGRDRDTLKLFAFEMRVSLTSSTSFLSDPDWLSAEEGTRTSDAARQAG
jgi:hypothetical protein